MSSAAKIDVSASHRFMAEPAPILSVDGLHGAASSEVGKVHDPARLLGHDDLLRLALPLRLCLGAK